MTAPRRTVDVTDTTRVVGVVSVYVYDGDDLVDVSHTTNLVVDAGLSTLADALNPATPTGITHCAVGTDATAPAATDTQLGAEGFRKAVSAYTPNGVGRHIIDTYVTPGEANFTWAEVGWFIAASATPGSGILYARAAVSVAKTSSVAVLIRREDILT